MANLKFMHYKFKAYICSELAGKNCKLSDRVTHAWDSWKKILETITWNLQLTLTLCWLLMPPDVHYFLSCQFFFYARKNSRQKWPWIKESAFDTVETAGVEIHALWQVVRGKLKFIVKRWSIQKPVLVSNFFLAEETSYWAQIIKVLVGKWSGAYQIVQTTKPKSKARSAK